MLPTRNSLQMYTHRLKVKGWKKLFHVNGNKKKAGIVMLSSDKIDFKTKAIIRKKRALPSDKGSIQQENVTFVNIYTPTIKGFPSGSKDATHHL